MKQNKGSEERKNTESRLTLRHKRILAIASALLSVALIAWLCYFVLQALHVSLSSEGGLHNAAENFKNIIESYGKSGVLVAFGIYVLQVIVSPLPGEIIEIGMGLCFDWHLGALICLAGSALGALIIMLFVKKLGIRFVELFVPVEKLNRFKVLNDDKKLEYLVFIIYLLPGTPKDLLIFFFGLTKINIPTFIIVSTIARIPSIITSTMGGNFILEKNYFAAILLFAITGAVSLLGLLIYNAILNKHNKRKALKQEKINQLNQKEQ